MRKDNGFSKKIFCALAAAAWVLVLPGCPMEATNEIERVDVVMSDIFDIGSKATSGSNHGWLDDPDGDGIWEKVTSDLSTEGHYDGVRIFNIDRDLDVRGGVFDAGPYDGIVFKYRTNVYNTEFRFMDFSFWFGWANEDLFPAWDWEGGFGSPTGYKEVVIPFYEMGRWGIQQSTGRVDNDLTNFDPNQLCDVHIDGRAIVADGGTTTWLEIVDFAFFYYK
ncbi:MAG: hypothetical protein LBT87_04370 [Treponema sp.]|jgi:hypothetical protein|nr:hypothetical protein [Treponema sp.]